MRELFRDRRFRLLFAGQAATAAGDSMMLLVLPVWMKMLTGSSGLAGAVMLAMALPTLVSPVLGWAADRLRRRPLLIWVYLGSAVALLPLYLVRGRDDFWIIFVIAVLYGISFILATAGLAGLLQHVVADERLAEANGALRTLRESLRLVGPVAGAGLYALVGAGPVITLNLLSFLIAAACLMLIRLREQSPRRTELSWLAEAGAGFRHLFAEPVLRRTALAMAAAFLAFGTLEAGAFAYVDAGLHRPATFVGVLVTIMGIGSVVGGLLAPRLIKRIGEPGALAAGLAALVLGLGPLVIANVGVGLAAVPFAGIGVALAAIAFSTVMQRRTPRPLMGRVSTAAELMTGVPHAASLAVSAILVSTIDYRWLFGVDAVALSLIAALLWRVRTGPEDAGTPAQPAAAAPVAELTSSSHSRESP